MKLFSRDGIEMMDVKSIALDGDKLVIKGKMMGSMATTIFLHPQDGWKAFKLFKFADILYMPLFLLKGFLRERKSDGGGKA